MPVVGTSQREEAAEADEPHPVLALQIDAGERRGGAHGAIVRAPPLGAHLGEGVEEEDDVGVPLWVLLVDPERAAERGRAPVDAPQPVPRLPLAQVGELDPLAAGARDLVAGEDLRLERGDERAKRLLAREDAQRLRLARIALPRAKAEHVAGAEEHPPDREHPPALAAQLQLDRLLLARTQADRPRGRSFAGRARAAAGLELEAVDAARPRTAR